MFIVHTLGNMIEFICHPCGLHSLDLNNPKNAGIMLAIMVKEQYNIYSKAQVEGARKACCPQGLIRHLSQRQFEELVHEKLLVNCPVTPNDVITA